MDDPKSISNRLIGETSPYLQQHANNPVDWYPWDKEAFDKAAAEDKPIFLSIGYSTCHWCHVMAHESFEDAEIAAILNRSFVSVKVDREERPDIDSVYMSVCQAFTGSGGWPTSIFMTAEQKPFFAGTYFPRSSRYGSIGFRELLLVIEEQWQNDRASLVHAADTIAAALDRTTASAAPADTSLIEKAIGQYGRSFDKEYGGFGAAPKFPAPHNLLFLLTYHQKYGSEDALHMAEKTLDSMYIGGMFDHIGYGFCRYSTDRRFLVPHFEKMLYDNALITLACCMAYEITQKQLYLHIAEKIADYILREMRAPSGAFFSAQDADSGGAEGGYYLFEPEEVIRLLGEEDGKAFNRHYDITPEGNYEGKSIPNLLHADPLDDSFDALLTKLRSYRRERSHLSTDDKILTAWNALMIAALCALYRVTREPSYLDAAKKAQRFIEDRLCDQDRLFHSFRIGRRGESGFLEDYANYAFALLALYHASLDKVYLERTEEFARAAISEFLDTEHGGFYMYGRMHETLLLRPKESYDGATPSGNSMMAYVLVRLQHLRSDDSLAEALEKHMKFMCGEAEEYPMGHAMFLIALLDLLDPPDMITVAVKEPEDIQDLPFKTPLGSIIRLIEGETAEYPLQSGKTTYYLCRGKSCRPPVNRLENLHLK